MLVSSAEILRGRVLMLAGDLRGFADGLFLMDRSNVRYVVNRNLLCIRAVFMAC